MKCSMSKFAGVLDLDQGQRSLALELEMLALNRQGIYETFVVRLPVLLFSVNLCVVCLCMHHSDFQSSW